MQFKLLGGGPKKKKSIKYIHKTFLKSWLGSVPCSVCFGFTSISSTAEILVKTLGCLSFVGKFVFLTTSMDKKLCIFNLGVEM